MPAKIEQQECPASQVVKKMKPGRPGAAGGAFAISPILVVVCDKKADWMPAEGEIDIASGRKLVIMK
jgi:hypothetical protein